MFIINNLYATILLYKTLTNFITPVCRAILYKNDLNILKYLLKNRFQTFFKIYPCIINRNYY